ncbi:MAG: VanZ family protein [Muribaculaceae bacterium]|nr:VanZ family protein [Muribaculaceae bacterium]
MKALKFISRWWPTMIVVAVIIYATLSAKPVGDMELSLIPHLDKLIHAIMFGGLFSAICFDRCRAGLSLSTSVLLLTALASAVAGGLDELAQSAMHNGRQGDFIDLAADCAGIAVAFFTAPPVIRRIFS